MSMAYGLLELVICMERALGLPPFRSPSSSLHFVVTSQISSVYTIGREKYQMVVCGVYVCVQNGDGWLQTYLYLSHKS